jgi:hypothetical protein
MYNHTHCVRHTAVLNGTSFSAWRSTSMPAGGHVTFDDIHINDGRSFDESSYTYTPPMPGLYWLTFSTGVAGSTYANVSLQGDVHRSLRSIHMWSPHSCFVRSIDNSNVLVQNDDNNSHNDILNHGFN